VSASPFAEPLAPGRARALPPATIAAASWLAAAVPAVAPVPILPPFGLMMLLAWRQLAPGALRRWMPALLGFWDDLLSGQPLGSAVLLWSLCSFLVDLADQRLMYRDFRTDWLVATVALAFALVVGRYLATPFGAPIDPVLGVQVMVAALTFPAALRICAWLDRKRGPNAP
jgi:rod shape-determining protein MreD